MEKYGKQCAFEVFKVQNFFLRSSIFVAYFGEDFLAPADKVKRAFWLMPEVWSSDPVPMFVALGGRTIAGR